jgi:hypothetical protein
VSGRRPRRGGGGSRDKYARNILETGDEGQYEYQGGAEPGASEAGNIQAREFGVPQADLPGGVMHLVNPQSVPTKSEGAPERPADYHKYHGVPSDDGPYEVPSAEVDYGPRPAPEPKIEDAVPVYILERPGDQRMIREFATYGPFTLAGSNAGTSQGSMRLCVRDPRRVTMYVTNESNAIGTLLRVGTESDIDEGRGWALPGNHNVTELKGIQEEMYILNDPGNTTTAASFSAIFITEVPATGAD